MKVLRIWHAAVLAEYRKKIKAISNIEDVDLTLLIPHSWYEAGKDVRYSFDSSIDSNFRIITAPILYKNNIRKYVFLHQLLQVMSSIKPDVIDIEEEPSALVTAQVIWFRKLLKLNAPVIFHTAHNIESVYKPFFERIQRYVLHHADGAIVRNSDAKSILQAKQFNKPIFISGNGIDLTHFKPHSSKSFQTKYRLEGKRVIGYVGKLKSAKGIMTLLNAFSTLDDDNLALIIIGSGGLKPTIETYIKDNGLEQKVIMMGHQDQSSLPDYYNLMDMLVIPSETTAKWKESFGRVIIEAMACGVAVIGSSSGSIPETIQQAGLIFQEKNAKDLSEKLRMVLSQPNLKKDLIENGFQRAKCFSWESLAQINYQAYKEIINQRNS